MLNSNKKGTGLRSNFELKSKILYLNLDFRAKNEFEQRFIPAEIEVRVRM